MLRDFQQRLDGTLPERPLLPPTPVLDLRRALIREEYTEVMAALDRVAAARAAGAEGDLTALVHELTDLLYVVYGTFWACGVDPDPVFAEVHRANMSKLGGPRRADGKLMKPATWQPADVAGVLARLGDSAE